jgi:parallel beta-helix repeat protein
MNNKKAQAAVEFLTIYGWVILLVLVVIMFLYYYGTFDPLRFVQRQCNFELGFGCATYKFEQVNSTTMKFTVQFYNNLDYDIAFQQNSTVLKTENIGKRGKVNYTGNCRPNYPGTVVKAGDLATCIYYINNNEIVPSLGKNLNLKLELNYTNCNTDPNYLLTKSCLSGTTYRTSGNIVTPMETYTPAFLYCGDGNCTRAIGENPTTCPADCTPPTVILLNASPKLVTPDGVQYSVITARLLNSTGSPMSGVDVSFLSIPIGNLSSISNTTDSSGEAKVLLRSNAVGVAKVIAFSGDVSNETTVTFRVIPATILLGAYDTYFGICGGGSYIIAQLKDSANRPVSSMEINFSHNATGTSNLTPSRGTTDENGLVISYFMDNKPEDIRITARLDSDELGVHLSNSTVVTAVNCQACNAPVRGDWVIQSKVVCENKTITLNGDLNISVVIGYVRKWGDLTFKNVTLRMNLTSKGQYGLYVNKNGSFHIFDNDNRQETTADRSNIVLGDRDHGDLGGGYPFVVAKDAAKFEMYNSYIKNCGYNTTVWYYNLMNISGLFIQADNTTLINNTIDYSFMGAIFYNSKNHTIYGNIINDTEFISLYFDMVKNSNITNNYMYTSMKSVAIPPVLKLEDSDNNTIRNNIFEGDWSPAGWATGAGIQLVGSTNNTIINNRIDSYEGIKLSSSSYNYIIGNNGTGFMGNTMTLDYSHYNKILNNNLSARHYIYNGIEGPVFSNSNYNEVSNNHFITYDYLGGNREFRLSSSNNNNFTNNRFGAYAYNGAEDIQNSYNNMFLNNIFTDAGFTISSSSLELRNNSGSSGRIRYITLSNSIANISGSNIYSYKCGIYIPYGISATDSTVNISNNTIADVCDSGIYLKNSQGTIERNYIDPPRDDCYICDSDPTRADKYGIYVENSPSIDFISNTIVNSNFSGIYFNSSNSNAVLNTITGSARYGVYCQSSTPTFSGNTISGSGTSDWDYCGH